MSRTTSAPRDSSTMAGRRTESLRMIPRLLGYSWRSRRMLGLVVVLARARVAVDLGRPWPAKIVADHVLVARPLPPGLAGVPLWLPGAGTPRGLLLWCMLLSLTIALLGAVL